MDPTEYDQRLKKREKTTKHKRFLIFRSEIKKNTSCFLFFWSFWSGNTEKQKIICFSFFSGLLVPGDIRRRLDPMECPQGSEKLEKPKEHSSFFWGGGYLKIFILEDPLLTHLPDLLSTLQIQPLPFPWCQRLSPHRRF